MLNCTLSVGYRQVFSRISRAFSTLSPEEMATLHHGTRPRYRGNPKFKSPQKRASKLLHELQVETINKSKAEKPAVWETNYRVGDALEVVMGRTKEDMEKVRGVVIGRFRKGLDEAILLRDVVYGLPLERLIKLHSPLIQSVKLLEQNFIYKGKRKVKRAKLYFLRDRNPAETRVSKY